MISISRVATTVTVIAGLLASQAAVIATSAHADEGWRRRSHQPQWSFDRGRHALPYRAPRRDRTGDAVGAAILGIGAVIVGAAIADAARQQRHRNDD